MSRYLNVMGHDLPINEEIASGLLDLCLANECGDDDGKHDLHLADDGNDPHFAEKLALTLAGRAASE